MKLLESNKCWPRSSETSYSLNILLVALFTLTLYGCASSTGVLSHGNNRYQVEGSSEFGLSSAKDAANKDAAEFCGSPQKVNHVSSRNDSHVDVFGDRVQTWELIFDCGSSSDGAQRTVENFDQQDQPEPQDYQLERQVQAVRQAYDKCTLGRLHDQGIIQACSEAIRLDPRGSLLKPEARRDVFFNRSMAYARLKDYDRAIADMSGVVRVAPGDREARNILANLTADRAARSQQNRRNSYSRLVFNGFWCPRVQKDSVLYPANELIINIIVTDQDNQKRTTALPSRGKSYNNIKKGTARYTQGIELWEGQRQPLVVQATMWEYDDGGPLVDQLTEVAVDFALTRGTKTMAKYAVKKGAKKAVAKGAAAAANEAIDQVDLAGQLSSHISSLPKAFLGTANDLVGAVGIANVSADSFPQRYQEHRFNYNFRTRFTRGGADCRMYFEFKQG